MDRGRRRQADRLADIADGRRVAVLARIALDEVENLLLTLREVELDHGLPPWGQNEHVFDTVGSPADDFNPMSAFLILHGLEGSGPDHWQTWLAGRLRERGERVSYPHLPDPFDPHPADWDRALTRSSRCSTSRSCSATRSPACCGCAPSRGRAPSGSPRACCSSRRRGATMSSRSPASSITARGRETSRARPAETLIVCSDDDPYCPPGAVATYAEPLGIPAHVIPGAGHINTDAGYGEWPDVEAWALGEAAFPVLYSR